MSGSDKRPVQQADPGAHAGSGYGRDGGPLSYATTGENPTTGVGGSSTTGAVTVSASTLVLSAGELSGNAIELADRGQFDFTGGRLMVGTFVGTLIQGGGTLEPGGPNSGETTVHGNYYLGSEGTLRMQLLGPTAQVGYDQLTVNGSVEIHGGNLDLVLGFVPEVGDSFTIIKVVGDGPVRGEFAGLEEGKTFFTTFGDKTVPMVITYGPADVTVKAAVPSILEMADLIAASGAMATAAVATTATSDSPVDSDLGPGTVIPLDPDLANLVSGEQPSGEDPASDPTGGDAMTAASDTTGASDGDSGNGDEAPSDDQLALAPPDDASSDGAQASENHVTVALGLVGPNHEDLTNPNLGHQTGAEQPSVAEAAPDSTGDGDGNSGGGYEFLLSDLPASAQAADASPAVASEFPLNLAVWLEVDDAPSDGVQTSGNGVMIAAALAGPEGEDLANPGSQTGAEQPSGAPSDSIGGSDASLGDGDEFRLSGLLASEPANDVFSYGAQSSDIGLTGAPSDPTGGSGGNSGDGDQFQLSGLLALAQADNVFSYGPPTPDNEAIGSAALVYLGGETLGSPSLAIEPEQPSVPATAPDPVMDLAFSVPLLGLHDGLHGGLAIDGDLV